MNTDTKPVPNPVVVLREEDDAWAILFNPDTGDAVGINPVGVQIWKLMDGSDDVGTITRELVARYQDAPETVADEVGTFVDQLCEGGFASVEG